MSITQAIMGCKFSQGRSLKGNNQGLPEPTNIDDAMYDGTLKRDMGWTPGFVSNFHPRFPKLHISRSQIDAGAILSAIAPEDGESLHSFIERSLLQARMHAHVMIWRHSAGDAVDFYAHYLPRIHWARGNPSPYQVG